MNYMSVNYHLGPIAAMRSAKSGITGSTCNQKAISVPFVKVQRSSGRNKQIIFAQQHHGYLENPNQQPRLTNLATPWKLSQDQPLTQENLDLLWRNEIPAIRIANFATTEECRQMIKSIDQHATFETYGFTNTAASIYKIGPAQCEFPHAKKAEYFNKSEQAKHLLSLLEQQGINPVSRLISLLQQKTNQKVTIAQEPKLGQYHAGVIRRMTSGALLHLDWAPLDSAQWAIDAIDSQLAWNLYIDAPNKGGSCIVYNRPWCVADEQNYKVEASYHYNKEVVQGCQSKENAFVSGDLVLFNSRNFHEVEPSIGTRLTFSSFIGRTKTGMVLWS